MQTFKAALVVATMLVALVVSIHPGAAADNNRLALTIAIDGAIGPASPELRQRRPGERQPNGAPKSSFCV